MKTTKPLPNISASVLMPPDAAIALKAFFCAQALQGCIASQDEAVPVYTDEGLVERAYRLGEAMFELYVDENPPVVRKFNTKVGLQ